MVKLGRGPTVCFCPRPLQELHWTVARFGHVLCEGALHVFYFATHPEMSVPKLMILTPASVLACRPRFCRGSARVSCFSRPSPLCGRSLGSALSLSGLSRRVSFAVPALWGSWLSFLRRGLVSALALRPVPRLSLRGLAAPAAVLARFLSVSRRVFAAFGFALGSAASRFLRPPGLGGASFFPSRRPWLALGRLGVSLLGSALWVLPWRFVWARPCPSGVLAVCFSPPGCLPAGVVCLSFPARPCWAWIGVFARGLCAAARAHQAGGPPSG